MQPYYNYSQTLGTATKSPSDFSFRDFLIWFYATIGFDYSQVIDVVTKRINWNKGIMCIPIQTSSECYRTWEVELIINTYHNLVINNGLAQYDRKNNPGMITQIETLVQTNSGRPIERVKIILWELYWATLDGTIRDDGILFPLKIEEVRKQRVTPEKYKSENGLDATINLVNTSINWLNYALIGLVVGGVAFVGYKIYKAM